MCASRDWDLKTETSARHTILGLTRIAGGFALARTLTRSGLRILCYHGISLVDEHELLPKLFMQEETFRRRLEFLRRKAHPVLGLDEALALLEAGRLPPRAVVITFDDGWLGTATKAAPALQEFGFRSTLYVTTGDLVNQVPVFFVALCYLLWKGSRRQLDLSALGFGSGPLALDTTGRRERAAQAIELPARDWSAAGKLALLREIAQMLQVDWREFERDRLFRLMDQRQLAELPARGMDLQLHTHGHGLPVDDAAEGFVHDRRKSRRVASGGTATASSLLLPGRQVPRAPVYVAPPARNRKRSHL